MHKGGRIYIGKDDAGNIVGEITGIEYAEWYKIAERTARADLSELVEKKLLYKKGETESVKYLFNAEYAEMMPDNRRKAISFDKQ